MKKVISLLFVITIFISVSSSISESNRRFSNAKVGDSIVYGITGVEHVQIVSMWDGDPVTVVPLGPGEVMVTWDREGIATISYQTYLNGNPSGMLYEEVMISQ